MTFLGSAFRGVVVALALSGAACFDSGDRPDKGPPPPPSPVEVDLTHGRITVATYAQALEVAEALGKAGYEAKAMTL